MGEMFRPDKPLKLYHPDFDDPRSKWGDEVWIHLKSFRKRFLNSIPEDYFKIDGDWIPECNDYAIMIPIIEVSNDPIFTSMYYYWHQRTGTSGKDIKEYREKIIGEIINKHKL